jgi:hypothetical protein
MVYLWYITTGTVRTGNGILRNGTYGILLMVQYVLAMVYYVMVQYVLAGRLIMENVNICSISVYTTVRQILTVLISFEISHIRHDMKVGHILSHLSIDAHVIPPVLTMSTTK